MRLGGFFCTQRKAPSRRGSVLQVGLPVRFFATVLALIFGTLTLTGVDVSPNAPRRPKDSDGDDCNRSQVYKFPFLILGSEASLSYGLRRTGRAGGCCYRASGARRPKAGDVRIEARRAKTWRALGQGLVHESRPPKGARMRRWVSLVAYSGNRFFSATRRNQNST